MSDRLRVGVAQMCAGTEVAENTAWITSAMSEMAAEGVTLACFPENATALAPPEARLAIAEEVDGRQLSPIREAAAKLGISVLVGSFVERGPDPSRSYNTSVVIAPNGNIASTYRKIHLFDVTVSDDTTFRESDTIAPGEPIPVVADIDGWKVGLSICYDLRFPELYRRLVEAGAEVLTIPAAFTLRTGMAHWEVLLRARAIENLSYVLAPAQVGRHYGRRESYGDAMVVTPWGVVASRVPSGPGWCVHDLNRSEVTSARAAIPCLDGRRM